MNWQSGSVGERRSHNLKVGGTKRVGGGVLLRSELLMMMIEVKGEHL